MTRPPPAGPGARPSELGIRNLSTFSGLIRLLGSLRPLKDPLNDLLKEPLMDPLKEEGYPYYKGGTQEPS